MRWFAMFATFLQIAAWIAGILFLGWFVGGFIDALAAFKAG